MKVWWNLERKTSEVLEDAAVYMAKHGHCKGQFYTHDGRCCIRGALDATDAFPEHSETINYIYSVIPGKFKFSDDNRLKEITCFNDDLDTKPGAVVNALWTAAQWAKRDGR